MKGLVAGKLGKMVYTAKSRAELRFISNGSDEVKDYRNFNERPRFRIASRLSLHIETHAAVSRIAW